MAKRKDAGVMRFRRAATLVATLDGKRIILHNYLTRARYTCTAECLDFLAALETWHTPAQMFAYFPDVDREQLAEQITELVATKALLVKGTPEAEQDERFRKSWEWGAAAGFYHFAVRETKFFTKAGADAHMRRREAWRPSPALHQPNPRSRPLIRLPKADLKAEPIALMRRRRSRRDFTARPLPLQALADCLYAGNGILKFVDSGVYGRLPLTMTPSGGARNPYELYVYAARVTGLKPGFYHYGALRHDLGLVRAGKVDAKQLLAGQSWPAKAAAIIFLVAHFPRSMWKYHLPIAYRLVMLEAGFIGQNIALAATHHGLSAVPSGALDEPRIEGHLGTPPLESAVVFSLSLGEARGE